MLELDYKTDSVANYFIVCSAGVVVDPTAGYKEGDRFFYFPGDGDGKIHLVDSHAPVDEEFIRSYARNPNNNAYWLYTRSVLLKLYS